MNQPKEVHQLKGLFHEVQMKAILEDGKTFPDCLPKFSLKEIEKRYEEQKDDANFDLKTFIFTHFELPEENKTNIENPQNKPVEVHIDYLWTVLTRRPDKENSSIIPLPYPYIVPGGRFREIYYWDSYFTMLGLQTSKRTDLMQYMVDNFAYLIDLVGYIPNGNRSYYIGRSQPPFFALMVKLLSEEKGEQTLLKYIPQLEKEYQFWMQGTTTINGKLNASQRVVKMPDGSLLNRYWDENNSPRPESYKEDVELAEEAQDKEIMYRYIRAAAESGWDFSSRWFKEPQAFQTIHTTDIIPVDLNCLLYYLESTLAEGYVMAKKNALAKKMLQHAEKRKRAIQKYFWSDEKRFYLDYDHKENIQIENITAAASFPLFFKIATQDQAEDVAQTFHAKLLKRGGIQTTLNNTGQQWDAPNGWAPLQYMIIKGLENYNMPNLAREIATRWIKLNRSVYERTGKLMEKYNVVDLTLDAGGGEYPAQDGFGWTNGVLIRLINDYNKKGKKKTFIHGSIL